MPDFSLLINPSVTPRAPYGVEQAAILNANGLFLAAARDKDARQKLDLDNASRVVLFGTKGATDAKSYAEIVGSPPKDVTPN
ncbi:MAG: hypothetical protein CMF67_06120 [Magnetovibrio sp.]|nr:hypothetical protein [Magnetovibrio sp.]|tara:strand:+ start:350 stop:595 length:246 start_codon:yes stop_codon:yes gene_type:complete